MLAGAGCFGSMPSSTLRKLCSSSCSITPSISTSTKKARQSVNSSRVWTGPVSSSSLPALYYSCWESPSEVADIHGECTTTRPKLITDNHQGICRHAWSNARRRGCPRRVRTLGDVHKESIQIIPRPRHEEPPRLHHTNGSHLLGWHALLLHAHPVARGNSSPLHPRSHKGRPILHGRWPRRNRCRGRVWLGFQDVRPRPVHCIGYCRHYHAIHRSPGTCW